MLVVVYFLCCLCLLVGFSIGEVAILEQDREETGMGPGSWGMINKLNESDVRELLQILGEPAIEGMKKAVLVTKLVELLGKIKKGKLLIVKASDMTASTATSSNDPNGSTASILTAIHESKAEILAAIKASHDDDNESSNDGSHDDDNESSNDKCFVMKIFSEDQLPKLEQTTSGIGEDIDILARIKRGDGIFEDLRMVFQYTKITTIGELKADISSFTGCSVDDFKLRMVGRMMVLENFDIIDSYMRVVTGAKELEMCVSLRGGGFTIKKHMTKHDAIKALQVRAIANIKKIEDSEHVNFPVEFNAFLELVKKRGQDVDFMKASGVMVVQTGLRHVSNDDLKALLEIMDLKAGRRGTTEDRVLRAIQVMFPTMGMLDNAKSGIDKLQSELAAKFAGIYAEEYNSYSAGTAMFDNVTFIKHVEAEQTRRQTLQGLPVQVAVSDDSQSQNCSIS
jgi:hypothetical protein